MAHYVFRVDSSLVMGSGHVMRCLTFADTLRQQDKNVSFICRELPGDMCKYIEDKGYQVYRLPYRERLSDIELEENTAWSGEIWENDALQTRQILQSVVIMPVQWLIIDHYGLDIKWEQLMRSYVKEIMVIDDIADRKHDCDLLIDQNLYLDMQVRYENLIPKHCKTLLGPQYALLRQEFYDVKQKAKVRDGSIKRILVFFGGSDPTNETMKAIHAIALLNNSDITIDVVVGKINPHIEEIRQYCHNFSSINFHCQVNNMAELMVNADLAIGAGGSTTWERCYLGLPAITIILAENQKETTEAVAQRGAIINLGWYSGVYVIDIYEKICGVLQSNDQLKNMSREAFAIVKNPSSNSNIKNILKIMGNIEKQEKVRHG